MKTAGVHDIELTLWFISIGCTLDEANGYADETVREIEFAKDYEVYQDELLGNSSLSKVEVSKRFIGATNEEAAIIS